MSKEAPKGKSLADFRALHDRNVIIPNKIKAALASMQKLGNENWEYESDFMKLAGICQTDVSKYREQFADYIAVATTVGGKRTPRNVWFATPKAAATARGE